MKNVVFDSSTVISLAMQNLLWILEPLKKAFKGEFYISEAVKRELVDRPLASKKFKYEALFIMYLLKKGIFKVYEEDLTVQTNKLMFLSNHSFKAQDWMNLVHEGEMEALALALKLDSEAIFVDERTTRLLVESPRLLYTLLKKKLHTKISVKHENVFAFKKMIKDVKVLRSSELIIMGYELGIFDKFVLKENLRKTLLDGLLWGTRLRGCSISFKEIENALKLEKL